MCILRIPRSLKRKLPPHPPDLRRVHHDDWADDVWNFVCADFVKKSVCGGQGCWLRVLAPWWSTGVAFEALGWILNMAKRKIKGKKKDLYFTGILRMQRKWM